MASIFDSIPAKIETPQALVDLRDRLMTEGLKVRHITASAKNPFGGDHYESIYDDGMKAIVEAVGSEVVSDYLSNYAMPILRKTLDVYNESGIKKKIAGDIEFFKQGMFQETIQIGQISFFSKPREKGKIDSLECSLE
ncbi:MAG TPA: hypothetical protein VJB94_03925 [Candidatus Nanoarchaeia archaeon]|nr:hypothetical protein [Candidatus Nanoarchaeia archaeon]